MPQAFLNLPIALALALGVPLAWAQSGAPKPERTASPRAAHGLIEKTTSMGVAEVVERIENAARQRGLTVFARIDHAAAARDAGLELRPTVLLLVGNPKGGTPVMKAAPTAAIDLPLHILVTRSDEARTSVYVEAPARLAQKHAIPDDLAKNIAGAERLVEAALKR